jgi:hypothetical protein
MKTLTLIALLGCSALAYAGDDPMKQPEKKSKRDEPPKAPNEMADRVKAMSGTWKCDGTGMGMDGKSMPFAGTMTSKADLDGTWVHDSFAGTMGAGKAAMNFKFESYSTFDAATKKWRSMFMDSMGGSMVGTSDPMKDGKIDTINEAMDPRGKSQFKDHTDASDMKKGVHMWGEASRDNGKTWNKVYDMTCKK